jgi:SAM-dependent methyltransferase
MNMRSRPTRDDDRTPRLDNSHNRHATQKPALVIIFYYQRCPQVLSEALTLLCTSAYTLRTVNLCECPLQEEGDSATLTTVQRINAAFERAVTGHHTIIAIGAGEAALPAACWVHDYAPALAALILAAPRFLSSPGGMATSFQREATWMRRRLFSDCVAIGIPVLLAYTCRILRREKSVLATLKAGLATAVVHQEIVEVDKPSAYARLATLFEQFIQHSRSLSADTLSLLYADCAGNTCEERNRLSEAETNRIKRVYWQLSRAALTVCGRHSTGIALGLEHGFDSGVMLDYVYSNQATGKNGVGRFIDRLYLNSIPWRGVRIREQLVAQFIAGAVGRLKGRGNEINLLDIAAGYGRYFFQLPEQTLLAINAALLRDYDPLNVARGNALIQEKGLENSVTYQQADAFSEADLTALPADRTLAIASGFYELFSDNTQVLMSLRGISRSLMPGGYLVYTGIPWHPRQEFMARVMVRNGDKSAWVLRRRTQRELDFLIASAGFVKLTQRTDPWGIFSVSLACKLPTESAP